MGLEISRSVRNKLAGKIPPVTEQELVQCFANRCGKYLIDQREKNDSDPPTRWFIAETDFGRKLKIAFIPRAEYVIRTAYDPDQEELRIYNKYAF